MARPRNAEVAGTNLRREVPVNDGHTICEQAISDGARGARAVTIPPPRPAHEPGASRGLPAQIDVGIGPGWGLRRATRAVQT